MSRRESGAEKVQSEAHSLLQEWACGGAAALLQDGEMTERIQGDTAHMSGPERYAHAYARWNRLDRSVRQVAQMSRELGQALHDHYGKGMDEQECAEAASLGLRTWRDRLKTARAAFLAAYNMACRPIQDDEAQDMVREEYEFGT